MVLFGEAATRLFGAPCFAGFPTLLVFGVAIDTAASFSEGDAATMASQSTAGATFSSFKISTS